MKINSGVIRNPPPIPNMPEMNPTARPIASSEKDVDGNVGDRKINLHGWSTGARLGGLDGSTPGTPGDNYPAANSAEI